MRNLTSIGDLNHLLDRTESWMTSTLERYASSLSEFTQDVQSGVRLLLVRRETPRLCRGGRKSLTAPAVCFSIQVPRPVKHCGLEPMILTLGSGRAPLRGPRPVKPPALPEDTYSYFLNPCELGDPMCY